MGFSLEMLQVAIVQALTGLLTTVTLYLPRLVNAAILLLLGWVLGRLAAALLGRLLTRLNFDKLLEQSGLNQPLAQAGVELKPSRVLARLVYWLLLLTFLLAAVDALGLQTAAQAVRELLGYIPNLIGAVLVIIGGGLLARFLGQTAQTMAARANLDFHCALAQATRYFFLAITFALAAGQLGLNVSFLGGALANIIIVIVAAAGLAFALGGRDLLKNMLAGIYAKEIFELGQDIQVQTYRGTLESVGPLKAMIATDQGDVTVPNSLLIDEIVVSRPLQP